MKGSNVKIKALKVAFLYTLPIFAGFCFLGMAYGIYMNVSGFSFWYPCLMSLTIFGGSLEFVAVSMLMSAFAPIQALIDYNSNLRVWNNDNSVSAFCCIS